MYVILAMIDVNDLEFSFFEMSIFLDTAECLRTFLGNYMAATKEHRTQLDLCTWKVFAWNDLVLTHEEDEADKGKAPPD